MKTTKTIEDRAEHNCKVIATYPIQVSALLEKEGGSFQALFLPLARNAVGYGTTPQEAIADLQKVVPLFLRMMDEMEQTLPEVAAEKEWDDFSGKFNVRVAKALHAQLVELAEEQGVSLNSLVQTVLTSGATALAAGKMFGALERSENEISAAAGCGVSKRAQRQAAAGKWPLKRPQGSDKQGYEASSEALTS